MCFNLNPMKKVPCGKSARASAMNWSTLCFFFRIVTVAFVERFHTLSSVHLLFLHHGYGENARLSTCDAKALCLSLIRAGGIDRKVNSVISSALFLAHTFEFSNGEYACWRGFSILSNNC